MRSTSSIAAVALAASLVSALQVEPNGGLKVINRCAKSYDWKMVPDPRGGGSESQGTLASGGEYFTNWIQLNSLNRGPTDLIGGWCMKVNTVDNWDKPLQIEYTWPEPNPPYVDGQQISWDISYVDLPQSDWEKTPVFHLIAPNSHDNFYRFWNDDHNGMQTAVPKATTATVVLCPTKGDWKPDQTPMPAAYTPPDIGGAVQSVVSNALGGLAGAVGGIATHGLNVVAQTTAAAPAPAPTTAAPAPPPPAPTTSSSTTKATTPSTTPSTTSSAAAPPSQPPAAPPVADVVVTVYETNIVTAYVTATAPAPAPHRRRHIHGHGHNHHRQ